MPTFDSGGVDINYVVEGEGRPIVLVHGFASSLHGNWRQPGVVDALVADKRRVIALDCRGHGRSGKPHEPEAYGGTKMADDVIALMDHLGVEQADLMGYSMGGFISLSLLLRHPERFRAVILGGIGGRVLAGNVRREGLAESMEAKDASEVTDATAKAFRVFAERSGNDLEALAAMQRSGRMAPDMSGVGQVQSPVLIVVGDGDTLAESADKLAAAIPGAKHVVVPGDHLTVFGKPDYTKAVLDFLAETAPVEG
jgi:pimeloyl-ACP methyl ester carboxylesterase